MALAGRREAPLCRPSLTSCPTHYITRPALSDERVQLNAPGQVELKLKTPWRDGTPMFHEAQHLQRRRADQLAAVAAAAPRQPSLPDRYKAPPDRRELVTGASETVPRTAASFATAHQGVPS